LVEFIDDALPDVLLKGKIVMDAKDKTFYLEILYPKGFGWTGSGFKNDNGNKYWCVSKRRLRLTKKNLMDLVI